MTVRYSKGEKADLAWGTWEVLETGKNLCVKRISVKTQQKLSLQTHQHRQEHWIIVQGNADVTLGKTTVPRTKNDVVFIPIGEFHRIKNTGNQDLVFIEVQTGNLLDEQDIIRYNEDYTPLQNY